LFLILKKKLQWMLAFPSKFFDLKPYKSQIKVICLSHFVIIWECIKHKKQRNLMKTKDTIICKHQYMAKTIRTFSLFSSMVILLAKLKKMKMHTHKTLKRKKLIFEGLNIVIIEIFKFFTMCINMYDDSNINNTSFE
jgi:hypothetical protein